MVLRSCATHDQVFLSIFKSILEPHIVINIVRILCRIFECFKVEILLMIIKRFQCFKKYNFLAFPWSYVLYLWPKKQKCIYKLSSICHGDVLSELYHFGPILHIVTENKIFWLFHGIEENQTCMTFPVAMRTLMIIRIDVLVQWPSNIMFLFQITWADVYLFSFSTMVGLVARIDWTKYPKAKSVADTVAKNPRIAEYVGQRPR